MDTAPHFPDRQESCPSHHPPPPLTLLGCGLGEFSSEFWVCVRWGSDLVHILEQVWFSRLENLICQQGPFPIVFPSSVSLTRMVHSLPAGPCDSQNRRGLCSLQPCHLEEVPPSTDSPPLCHVVQAWL